MRRRNIDAVDLIAGEAGLWSAIAGGLDELRSLTHQSTDVLNRNFESIGQDLTALKQKVALLEAELKKDRVKKAKELSRLLKALEALQTARPPLRKEPFGQWWEKFSQTVHMLKTSLTEEES